LAALFTFLLWPALFTFLLWLIFFY